MNAFHISLPTVHRLNSLRGVAFSFTFLLCWFVEIWVHFQKAHGAHGSEEKQAKIVAPLVDLYSAIHRGWKSCGEHTPTILIRGIAIPTTPNFDMDLSSVLPVFPTVVQDYNLVMGVGGLAPRRAMCEVARASALDVYVFLCRRCIAGVEPGSPLIEWRDAMTNIFGAMAERDAVACLTTQKDRRAHQVDPTPIFRKKGVRRARKSSVEVLKTLQLAEGAGHAEAIVRSTGSN